MKLTANKAVRKNVFGGAAGRAYQHSSGPRPCPPGEARNYPTITR